MFILYPVSPRNATGRRRRREGPEPVLKKKPRAEARGFAYGMLVGSAMSETQASFFLPAAAMAQKATSRMPDTTYQIAGLPPKKSII